MLFRSPTPSDYKKQQGIKGSWVTTDAEYHFWNNTLVRRILIDERYTGKGISNMSKVKAHGKKNSLKRPKDEWIIVPNAHQAIVSENDFQKALMSLSKIKGKDVTIEHIFYNKIKCSICGHTMKRTNKCNPKFKCGTKAYTDYYDCPEYFIAQSDIEKSVTKSIKAYLEILIEREELKLLAINQTNQSKSDIERKIKNEQKSIKLLEDSITKNFTAFASEKISQETFLQKKATASNAIALKKSELQKDYECLEALTARRTEISKTFEELKTFQNIEKLDRNTVDLLIDKILVYGEHRIDIVWTDRY